MRRLTGKFVLGTLSTALLLLATSQTPAQETKVPANTANTQTKSTAKAAEEKKQESRSTAEKRAIPVMMPDGRTVTIEGPAARTAPEATPHIEAAFNRRTPRDLRTYTLAEIITAAEGAANDGMAGARGGAAARVKVTVTVSCCPIKVVIVVTF